MRKILTFLMLLALAIPAWAGEKTVVISRHEGNIGQNGSGVYYIERDGIEFTLTGGLNNDNYLLYSANESSNTVFSYNYVIKKIVFHCLDDATEDNLDVFFWGPSTLSEYHGKGTYTYSGKTGTWVGSETSLHFATKGKPVRFGSIEVTYEKLEGDIFDLVTDLSQIQEGKSYILVSQTYDKVMSFKRSDDATHRSAPIVGWPLGNDNKSKVKVDGEARIYKMEYVRDSLTNRKNAFLNILNGYIRSHASQDYVITGSPLPASTDFTNREYYRAVMMLGTAYNCMTYFKGGNGTNKPIRYDYTNNDFRLMETSDAGTRAWLYKLAEPYHVYTACNPTDGGTITLGDGVLDGTSQEGETVNFTVTPNEHFMINNVTLNSNGEVTTLEPDENGNYSFTMPANDVTVTANFRPWLYLLGTANGETEWHPYGPRFNFDYDKGEYYIDVYFKGFGNYGDNSDSHGYFAMTKKTDPSNWDNIKDYRCGALYSNKPVDENSTDAYLCYGEYNGETYYDNAFMIEAGIYRIYVGTEASQAIDGGLNDNQLKIEKITPTLTFDPAGGASAATAVEVPQNQVVTLQGDLYNKIKAINANEADANFMYKATKTVAGNTTTETENATTATSNISVLDVVNAGETVTQLDGVNFLGWIVASNTAYYKVISTPLGWIEENGTKGNTYTIADRLQGIYAQGTSLWCKDLGNISIAKTQPATGQVDFLMEDEHTQRTGGWDQSNWVELDFSGYNDGATRATAGKDHYFEAATIKGEYTDDLNYKIKVSDYTVPSEAPDYLPNYYCTVNFLEANLMLNANSTGPQIGNQYYYFLNPKIQEYAIITYAMWDKPNGIMVVPDNVSFNGAVRIGGWDYNEFGNQKKNLDDAFDVDPTKVYEFHILVQRDGYTYGNALKAAGKTDQTPSSIIKVQPLDLKVDSTLPTAITDVATQAQVAGVEYVNIAGMRSSKPWNGINIVVTRYTDGTTTTTKVVK